MSWAEGSISNPTARTKVYGGQVVEIKAAGYRKSEDGKSTSLLTGAINPSRNFRLGRSRVSSGPIINGRVIDSRTGGETAITITSPTAVIAGDITIHHG